MEKYLRKLQLVELDILKEVDRICRANNIDYFICNGSLIGAIRHKGFIPWDDDIDIAMTRKNYEKFLKVCPQCLSDNYFLDCYQTNKKYCLSFAKVKRKGTLFVETKNASTYTVKDAIWMDVFPLDGCKKPLSKGHRFQYKMYSYITTLITIKNGSSFYQNSATKKKIYGAILKIVPMNFMVWLLNTFIAHYDEEKVAYLTSFSTIYGIDKETFEKDIVTKYQSVEFEKGKYSGLKNYDKYLTQIYGDYMKLPPKEKRTNHTPYLIKFEDGEEIRFKDKEGA